VAPFFLDQVVYNTESKLSVTGIKERSFHMSSKYSVHNHISVVKALECYPL